MINTHRKNAEILLSPEERHLLYLMMRGQSAVQSAAALRLTLDSVETIQARLQHRFGIDSWSALIARAVVQHWV